MFHLLDCKAAKNVICVTDIVNVKATQASTFQFVMLGLIHWINLVIDNITQLYFAFSQPKVFTLKQCFQFSLSPCVFVCVCVFAKIHLSLWILHLKRLNHALSLQIYTKWRNHCHGPVHRPISKYVNLNCCVINAQKRSRKGQITQTDMEPCRRD